MPPAPVDGATGTDAAARDGAAIDTGSATPCPATPPADGAACGSEGLSCTWLRCALEGEVQATCTGGAFDVTTVACEPVPCGGDSCGHDQICVITEGGALLMSCAANPCGDGAIEPSCACTLCGAGAECRVGGRTVTCNTCPSAKCP